MLLCIVNCADYRLQHLVGSPVSLPQPRPHWSSPPCSRRVQSWGEIALCWGNILMKFKICKCAHYLNVRICPHIFVFALGPFLHMWVLFSTPTGISMGKWPKSIRWPKITFEVWFGCLFGGGLGVQKWSRNFDSGTWSGIIGTPNLANMVKITQFNLELVSN